MTKNQVYVQVHIVCGTLILTPKTNSIIKSQLTIAYYTSILMVSTVMYTNSRVCAVSEPTFCSPALNIIQKNGVHTSAKACSVPGFSSYSKAKLSMQCAHLHINDNIVISP